MDQVPVSCTVEKLPRRKPHLLKYRNVIYRPNLNVGQAV